MSRLTARMKRRNYTSDLYGILYLVICIGAPENQRLRSMQMEANGVDELSVPETIQGKVTGIIKPPPDLRAIVDKTAQFVARNGRSFERKIAGETASGKFSFIKPSDPYHGYYEFKVLEFMEKGDESAQEVERKKQEEERLRQEKEAAEKALLDSQNAVIKAPVEAPVARAARSMPKEAPLPEEFILAHPPVSALESDIIRLTAQYTAISGKPFLSGLATREQRNPQFDFLKPTHPLFAYFTSFVESYAKVLSQDGKSRLQQGTKRMEVLDRCVHRLEWLRIEEERIQKETENDDAERLAFQQIDWHDFVIVETIQFTENEVVPQDDKKVNGNMDMDMDMDEDEDETPSDIKIVEGYTPQIAQPTAPTQPQLMTVDGRTVGTDQVNEHMRILLMDPKWRQENQRRLDKQKESAFAGGQSIADNLKRFAGHRGDIFPGGPSQQQAAAAQPPPGAQIPPQAPTVSYPPAPPPPVAYPPPHATYPPPPPVYHAPPVGGVPPPPPPPGFPMMPPVPPGTAPIPVQPPGVDEPAAKRARTGEVALLPEDEFAAANPGFISVCISVPVDDSNTQWKLEGQTVSVKRDIKSSVRDLKIELSSQLGSIPPSKYQLKAPVIGFLKDAKSLAFYNFTNGVALEFVLRKRGGRR